MKLVDAASYFDRTEVRDPGTGALLFKCQVDPYDDSKRDANAAYRRVMSVRPGTTMPASRVAKLLGLNWIVGGMEPDGLAELHREKYVIQRSTTTLSVSTLSGFLAGTVVSTVYANPQWVKDAKQLEVSSALPQLFEVYLPSPAAVAVHNVLWRSGEAYLVLAVHQQASGFQSAHCLKLDQTAPAAASLQARTYSMVTGAYTNAALTTPNALKVRWQSLYEYDSQMSERYQEGDSSIVLPTGTVVATAATLTLAGVTYQILEVDSIGGAVVVHARPV